MSYMYGILAVVGWTWTAIVFTYLLIQKFRTQSNQDEK